MRRRRTHEEFLELVFDLTKNEYSVLGEYIDKETKISIRHNICNYEWDVIPNCFIRGTRCPKCSISIIANKLRKSQETFVEEVFNLVKNEYTVLGRYINNHEKVEFIHNVCGYIWGIDPNRFLNGNRCPRCAGNIKKDSNIFISNVFDKAGEEYTVLGKYVNTHTKIEMLHNICGCRWFVEPNAFLRGSRCPDCFGNIISNRNRLSIKNKYLSGEWNFLKNGQLTPDDVTCGTNKKVWWICSKCKNEWLASIASRSGGTGCPVCSSSRGENKIFEYLSNHSFYFIDEHKFPDCKNERELPFDFYLPDLNICIEYDGIIHYEDKFDNPKEFKKVQKRDKIKTKYCKDNHIKLIRIPYWDFDNIETILEKELVK